jgi:hypothetical protein
MEIKSKFDYDTYNEDLENVLEDIANILDNSYKYITKEKADYLSKAIDDLLKAEYEEWEIEEDDK